MSNENVEERVEKACVNGGSNDESGQLVLYLNIADFINLQQGKGDCARNAVYTIAKLLASNVESVVKLSAIRLLDVLVKNCGYPIHLHISRKGFLQVISSQFHQHSDGSATYSTVQLELLMEINMWYHTICQWTSYKNELAYIKHLYNMIVDRGYHFPPLDTEELAVLKPRPHTIIRSFEHFNNEQRIILNSQISELRRRGQEKDLKTVNILAKKLRHFQSSNVTVEAQREILKGIEKWQEDIHEWNQKLDKNLLEDEDETHKICFNEMKQFIDSLKRVQSKVQHMLMEDLKDEMFINQLFVFNDQTLHLLTKFESYQDSLIELDDNDIESDSGTKNEELVKDMDQLVVSESQEDSIELQSTNQDEISESKSVKTQASENSQERVDVTEDKNNKEMENFTEDPEETMEKREVDEKKSVTSQSDHMQPTDAEFIKENDEVESQKSVAESVKTTNTFSNPISLLQAKTKPSLATSGFMFKPKVSNSAPVTTFAVSKAESTGQFKFDGTSNEINTRFKPFSDNPEA
ncbi:ADP-ribosylation factor-binding protein Gga1p [Monosporozyma servazzii]